MTKEQIDAILSGGTVGLLALFIVVVTALVVALGIVVRAFLKRQILPESTYNEMKATKDAQILEIGRERDEAIGGWKRANDVADRNSQAIEQLTVAMKARDELVAELMGQFDVVARPEPRPTRRSRRRPTT